MSRKNKNRQIATPALMDIVIVTGGRFDMLAKCLNALYQEAETTPINIILVDNATDGEEYRQNSDLFSKREGSKVSKFTVIHLKTNTGFPEANNIGARAGSSPLIMFLNDDAELQPGAIDKVIRTMDDPTIGITGIKLLFPPSSTSPNRPAGKVQHVGMALNIRGEPVHPLVGWSADHPKANVSRDVIAVTGACLTIRRHLFQHVGGFDPVYGMGTFEDTDLCFKIIQNGFRVRVNVEAVGYHYVGSTAEKKRTPFPLGQNRMIFQTKWGNSGLMQWTEWDFL